MKSIKFIVLIFFSSSILWSNSLDKLEGFDKFEQKTMSMFKVVNSGVRRDVYEILSSYDNPKSELIKKWFEVASQVTNNKSLAFFIKKTKYKVGAIVEQLLFDKKHPMSEKDREILHSKFNFLLQFSKSTLPVLNQTALISQDVYLRSMPIVLGLTNKKNREGNLIILRTKTPLVLLSKITYFQNDKIVKWGYVESKIDNRRGWVNLKFLVY